MQEQPQQQPILLRLLIATSELAKCSIDWALKMRHLQSLESEPSECSKRSVKTNPSNTLFLHNLANARFQVGVLQATSAARQDEALRSFGNARVMYERLTKIEPKNAGFRFLLANCDFVIANTRSMKGQRVQALDSLKPVLAVFLSLVALDQINTQYKNSVGWTYQIRGGLSPASGGWPGATLLRASTRHCREAGTRWLRGFVLTRARAQWAGRDSPRGRPDRRGIALSPPRPGNR